jgi:Ring finger domain
MGDQCTICCDELFVKDAQGSNECVPLPCGHCYHRGCIVEWMRQQDTCPTCKKRCSRHQQLKAIKPLVGEVVTDTMTLEELQEGVACFQETMDFMAARIAGINNELSVKRKSADECNKKTIEAAQDISALNSDYTKLREELDMAIDTRTKLLARETKNVNITFEDGTPLEATDLHRADANRVVNKGRETILNSMHKLDKLCSILAKQLKGLSKETFVLEKTVDGLDAKKKTAAADYAKLKPIQPKDTNRPSGFVPSTGLSSLQRATAKMSTERPRVLCRTNSSAENADRTELNSDVPATRFRLQAKRKSTDELEILIDQVDQDGSGVVDLADSNDDVINLE